MKLPEPTIVGSIIPAPEGKYFGVCLGVLEHWQDEVPNFEDPSKTEVKDRLQFKFGIKNQSGDLYTVVTRRLVLSGHERSNLFKFLKSWTGKPPEPGVELSELVGTPALITTVTNTGKNGEIYANIDAIQPANDGFNDLTDKCPTLEDFHSHSNRGVAAINEESTEGVPF